MPDKEAIKEIKKWLDDCRLSAFKRGYSDTDFLIALTDKAREVGLHMGAKKIDETISKAIRDHL